jgi:hypothetical protein
MERLQCTPATRGLNSRSRVVIVSEGVIARIPSGGSNVWTWGVRPAGGQHGAVPGTRDPSTASLGHTNEAVGDPTSELVERNGAGGRPFDDLGGLDTTWVNTTGRVLPVPLGAGS